MILWIIALSIIAIMMLIHVVPRDSFIPQVEQRTKDGLWMINK